jgi:hypothetical protein
MIEERVGRDSAKASEGPSTLAVPKNSLSDNEKNGIRIENQKQVRYFLLKCHRFIPNV